MTDNQKLYKEYKTNKSVKDRIDKFLKGREDGK